MYIQGILFNLEGNVGSATVWMNFEDIILSKISQSFKKNL